MTGFSIVVGVAVVGTLLVMQKWVVGAVLLFLLRVSLDVWACDHGIGAGADAG